MRATEARDDFLAGGGECGALARALDWAETPLGPPEQWPQSLRTTLSLLLNSKYPMFVFWGPQLVKIYNDAYRPITGDKHPWAFGRPGPAVWPEIWADIRPLVERALAGEATWSDDLLLFMRRSGFSEEVYFTFSYSPIRDESGGVSGMFCACTETTGRVLGERRMRTLRDLAARPLEARSVEDAGARSAEVLATNPSDVPFALIYLLDGGRGGLRLAASAGVPPDHPCSPSFVDGTSGSAWPLLHVIEQRRPERLTDLAERFPDLPPGPWPDPPASAMLLPLVDRGQERSTGVIVLGISSRRVFDDDYRGWLELVAGQVASSIASARALEEERRRAEALAELDRAKTTFFSNVSHEFRTPLTLILGPLERVLEARAGGDARQQRAELEVVRRNGLRLLKLVNTLLDFSRMEAGRAEASYEPTDLALVTADLAGMFRAAVESAGLVLRVECATLPEPVHVDREMWEKIVVNLLANALKFTFEGEIAVTVQALGDRVEVAVRDSGIGIAPEEIPHLFERFHRVRGVRSRSQEGTGIGLALVRDLVELHGGSVRVDSRLGEGSVFTVSIPTGTAHLPSDRVGGRRPHASTATGAAPYVEEALRWLPDPAASVAGAVADLEATGSSAAPAAPAGGRPRIVWADDNADMRDYVRRLLAPHYEVEAVADGAMALAVARARRPDLVLADVMMPELDGFGLLRALRADPDTRTLPVILLSARAGEEASVEGLGAGADAYLIKPFSSRELLAQVGAHVELGRMRARAEEERAALETLFLQAPVPIAVLRGEELVFEMANPAYRAVLGGRDVTGRSLLQALPELQAQSFDQTLRDVLRSGVAQVGHEVRIAFDRTGTGQLQDTYWTFIYAPLRAAGGEPRVVAICSDVTEQVVARKRLEIELAERRRAEAALRASEERYRTIFRTAPVSIWEEDFTAVQALLDELRDSGVTDLRAYVAAHRDVVRRALAVVRVDDVNDATLRMFEAASKAELLASLPALFPPEAESIFAEELVALFEGRTWFESEAVLRTLRGRPIHVLFSIAFPPPTERLDTVLVTVMDVTARRLAEAAAAQALRDADRRKDEFLATLSHELRTPLNAMLGWVRLLRSGRLDPATTAHGLEVVERSVNQQARLIADLLDVSRIVAGTLTLDTALVDLGALVREVLEATRPAAAATGLILTATLPDEAVPVVGDAVRLRQVVDNLLSNAVKFTPAGGGVHMRLGRTGSRVRLVVTDTGRGIPPEFLPHIFERFRQADSSTTRGQAGLGLGLAIARHIVELHEGRIAAASDGEGKGATLTVDLPALEPTALGGSVGRAAITGRLEPLDGVRVLALDDDPTTLDLVTVVLRQQGAQVLACRSVDEALATVRRGRPDVVVCDIAMPGRDGFAFVREIRSLPTGEGGAVPALALTAYARREDREYALGQGFQAHLSKPVEPAELVMAVARLAGARERLTPRA